MINPAAIFAAVAQSLPIQVYWPAKVIDQTDVTYDDGGSIADPGFVVERDCMVQVDTSATVLQALGYTDAQAAIMILTESLDGELNDDATVSVAVGPNPGTWLMSTIKRDSLAIYWQGRGLKAT